MSVTRCELPHGELSLSQCSGLGCRASLAARTGHCQLSTPGTDLGTHRCQGLSGPLQGCCVCWQELKIKNLLVEGGFVSVESRYSGIGTPHTNRGIEDGSQLPAGQAQHQDLCPEERIIMVLSHLALEEPESLNSK